VFLCPSAPKKYVTWDYHETDMTSEDHGWTWSSGFVNANGKADPEEIGHYGMNIELGGSDPDYIYSTGKWPAFIPVVPTDGMVRQPTRVILFCDSRWVDLQGQLPGRIGSSRFRHAAGRSFGAVNIVCCDGRAVNAPAREILMIDDQTKAKYKWDYR
jgi:hypothetical protein